MAIRRIDPGRTGEVAPGAQRERGPETTAGDGRLGRSASMSLDDARLLAELSPAPLFVVEDGQITFANAACSAILGYSPDELIARGINGLAHPDDLPMIIGYLNARLSGGNAPSQYVARFITRFGEVVWTAAHVVAVEIDGTRMAVGTVVDITERVAIEKALRESEQRWRSLVQTAPSFIVMVDGGGAILDINRVGTAATFEGIVGSHVYDYILPEYHDLVRSAIKKVMSTGETERIEYAGLTDDDVVTWYDSNLGPVEEDGAVVAVTVVTNDIAAKKATEDALRESEARFRSLVETAPSLILMVGDDCRILDVNRVQSARRADVIGRSVLTHITPEYHEVVRNTILNVFATAAPAIIEHEGVHSDGRTTWYSSNLGPVVRDGRVAAVTVVANEITERKAMEDALRESEAQIRALVETAPSFICTVDREGRYLSVNRTIPELDVSSVLGVAMFEYIDEESHEDVREALRIVFEEARVVTFECRALGPGGATVWYASAAGPTVRGGRVVSATIVSNDVTEQKEMRAELETLREAVEARAASQYKQGNPYHLSFREIMVLNLVSEGRSDRQIAETICISAGTVNKHVTNAMRKMGVSNRTEAAARAVREGII